MHGLWQGCQQYNGEPLKYEALELVCRNAKVKKNKMYMKTLAFYTAQKLCVGGILGIT